VKNRLEQLAHKLSSAVAGKAFYLVLGVVLLIGLVFRVVFLSADPPMGITRSQDFSTDPFQYVHFASNVVNYGEADPYNDPNYSHWRHTTQHILALVVFNIAGTGRAQGNAVGVIFNLASILLLALAIKNYGSRVGALFFAIIASFDFTMIWFGRTPFLEACQNFWLCGSVYLFSCRNRHRLYLAAAGLACAIAAFYGKIIAVYMLGVFAVVWILLYLNDEEDRKAQLKSAIHFYAGYAVGFLSWILFVYYPAQRQLSGYLSEQAVGLYGAPKALDSVGDFVWQYISLLWEHDFFVKMPVVTVLAYLFGAGVLTWFVGKRSGKKLFAEFNLGWVILVLWFAVGYLTLFPWNYRPLRYQTSIMFPAMAMAGVALACAFDHLRRMGSAAAKSKTQESDKHRNPALFIVLWAVWLLPLLSLILLWLAAPGTVDSIRKNALPYALVLLVVGAVIAVVFRTVGRISRSKVAVGALFSALLVVFLIFFNVAKSVDWIGHRQYTLITADRDLAAILNRGAVLAGPYIPALTQENRFGSIFHMFTTSRVDKEFFSTYPITHIAMDEGNEKQARADYPELMSRASLITRYFIRGFPVRVYRVSGMTQNEQAKQYVPSDFERAQAFVSERNNDSAVVYMQRFLGTDTPNYSANLYAADALYSQNKFTEALELYRKVQQFAPGDALSAFSLANCFMALGETANNAATFDSALVYYRIARNLYPQDKNLAETIKGLERRKR
jgi:tetratricopeptide (TPR) repeat protein